MDGILVGVRREVSLRARDGFEEGFSRVQRLSWQEGRNRSGQTQPRAEFSVGRGAALWLP